MMLAENVVELTIASQLEYIDLVTTLTDNITSMIGFDEESAYWINMAVRESVANAVEHGNKYDQQKSVDIRYTIGVDALRVTVRDYGEGFDPAIPLTRSTHTTCSTRPAAASSICELRRCQRRIRPPPRRRHDRLDVQTPRAKAAVTRRERRRTQTRCSWKLENAL